MTDPEDRLPVEDRLPSEDAFPREEHGVTDEENRDAFFVTKAEKQKLNLRELILKPVAAVAAALAVFVASSGFDPLGLDILGKDGLVGDDIMHHFSGEQNPGNRPVSGDWRPVLDNPDPDFAGDYAWSRIGPETYIYFVVENPPQRDGERRYIVMGTMFNPAGPYAENGELRPTEFADYPGAEYDRESNTLTLTDFSAAELNMNLMGNGLRIVVHGECSIGTVVSWGAMYGGSVTFAGDGRLTVNAERAFRSGLMLYGEDSRACFMFEKGPELLIYGTPPVQVTDSKLETVIFSAPDVIVEENAGGEYIHIS